MPTVVEVPGIGEIEFPDSMKEDEIAAVLRTRPWEKKEPYPWDQPKGFVGPQQQDPDLFQYAKFRQHWKPYAQNFGIPNDLGLQGMQNTGLPGQPEWIKQPGMLVDAFGTAAQAVVADLPQFVEAGLTQANPLIGGPLFPGERQPFPFENKPSIQEQRMMAQIPGYVPTPSNIRAAIAGEPLPADYQSKFLQDPYLGKTLQFANVGAQGLTKSAPRVGLMSLGTMAGLPMGAAAFGAFAPTSQGLDVKSGLMAAVLPYLGRYSGVLAGRASQILAGKMGVAADLDLVNGINAFFATATPASVQLYHEFHTIDEMVASGQMTKEEADEARFNAFASVGGMAALGPMGYRRIGNLRAKAPPIIPVRTKPPLPERPAFPSEGPGAPELKLEGEKAVGPQSGTITGIDKLSEYEKAMVEAERMPTDAPIEIMDKPSDVKPSPDDPFASVRHFFGEDRPVEGRFMQADRNKGVIRIYPGELERWLMEDVPEHQRQQAFRARLNEENIHLVIPPELAMAYWNSLPEWRKRVVRMWYQGQQPKGAVLKEGLNVEQNLADEALRFEVQRLNRGRVSEAAEMALSERTRMGTIQTLADIVDFLSSRPGPRSAAQREILNQLARNVEAQRWLKNYGRPPVDTAPPEGPFGTRRRKLDPDMEKLQASLALAAGLGPDKPVELPRGPGQQQLPLAERGPGEPMLEGPPLTQPAVREDLKLTGERTYARQDTEAAAVHGDLRPPPGEGAPQVPAPEGGPGVQPREEPAQALTPKPLPPLTRLSQQDLPMARRRFTQAEFQDAVDEFSYMRQVPFQFATQLSKYIHGDATVPYEIRKLGDEFLQKYPQFGGLPGQPTQEPKLKYPVTGHLTTDADIMGTKEQLARAGITDLMYEGEGLQGHEIIADISDRPPRSDLDRYIQTMEWDAADAELRDMHKTLTAIQTRIKQSSMDSFIDPKIEAGRYELFQGADKAMDVVEALQHEIWRKMGGEPWDEGPMGKRRSEIRTEEGPDLFGIKAPAQVSQEAYNAFAKGDQPVMADAQGQPIKVYHGTPGTIEGEVRTPAFFSDKPGTAKTYRGIEELPRQPGDLYTKLKRTGNLAEGYIKYKNPMQWNQDRTIGVDEARKIFATTDHDAILNPKFNEFVIKNADQALIEKMHPAASRRVKYEDPGEHYGKMFVTMNQGEFEMNSLAMDKDFYGALAELQRLRYFIEDQRDKAADKRDYGTAEQKQDMDLLVETLQEKLARLDRRETRLRQQLDDQQQAGPMASRRRKEELPEGVNPEDVNQFDPHGIYGFDKDPKQILYPYHVTEGRGDIIKADDGYYVMRITGNQTAQEHGGEYWRQLNDEEKAWLKSYLAQQDQQSGPFGERRRPIGWTGPKAYTPGLDLEGKQIHGPVQPLPDPKLPSKYKPVSPEILEEAVKQQILHGEIPFNILSAGGVPPAAPEGTKSATRLRSGSAYQAWVDTAAAQYGLKKDQATRVWDRAKENTLMNASAKELNDLIFKLNLRKSESRITSGMMPGDLAEPDLQNKRAAVMVQEHLKDVGPTPNLNEAIKRAMSPRVQQETYNKLMKMAKDARQQLNALGFRDVDLEGQLIPEYPPMYEQQGKYRIPEKVRSKVQPEVTDLARGLGKFILNVRDRMDKLRDPDSGKYAETRVRRKIRRTIPQAEQGFIRKENRPGMKYVTEGEVEIKEGEEDLAPPAFGVEARERQDPKVIQRNRARLSVIAAIWNALEEQAHPGHEAGLSRDVTPDDIAHYRAEPIRTITAEERANIPLVKAIMTAAPEQDRTTVEKTVIEGKETERHREAPKETETRNIVALRHRTSGEVVLVSAYQGRGRFGDVRVLDPRSKSFERVHSPADWALLNEWQPIVAFQLEDPVRNFWRFFKNEDQFRKEFLGPAREAVGEKRSQVQLDQLDEGEIEGAMAETERLHEMGVIRQEGYEDYMRELEQRREQLRRATGVRRIPPMVEGGRSAVKAALRRPAISQPEAEALANSMLGFREIETRQDLAEAIKDMRKFAQMDPKKLNELGRERRSQLRIANIAINKLAKKWGMDKSLGGERFPDTLAAMMFGVAQEGRAELVKALMKETAQPEEPPIAIGTAAKRAPLNPPLPSNIVEPTMLSREEMLRINQERQQLGLYPVGARRAPAVHVPQPYQRPEVMAPERTQQYLKAKLRQARQKLPGEAPPKSYMKLTGGSAEYYKWITGGFPKFESIGGGEGAGPSEMPPQRPRGFVGPLPEGWADPADPMGMRRRIANTVRYLGDNTPVEYLSGWMTHNIRNDPGAQWHANKFADKMEKVIDDTKAEHGDMSTLFDPAIKKAGQLALRHFNNWLDKVQPVDEYGGIANSVDAMEGINTTTVAPVPSPGGTVVPVHMPNRMPKAYEEEIRIADAANRDAGRRLFAVSPSGGQESGKFQRIMTPDMVDMLMGGSNTKDFQNYVKATVKANMAPGVKPEWWDNTKTTSNAVRYVGPPAWKVYGEVAEHFMELKRLMSDPTPNWTRIDKIAQDFRRRFPKAITHLKMEGRMGWTPMLYTHLPQYLKALQNRTAHVVGFRKSFPATEEGHEALVDLVKKTRTEIGSTSAGDINMLLRTVQGHSTDQMAGWSDPSGKFHASKWGLAYRALDDTALTLASALALTKQMITQTPETIYGPTAQRLGLANTYRAMGHVIADMAKSRRLGAEYEKQGMINRVMYDWSFNPHSPIRSAFRLGSNTVQKLFGVNFLNEFQEAVAAATAHVVAERIVQKRISPREEAMLQDTFQKMGFNKIQVARMMQGDPAVLNMFKRRASAWLTTGNKHLAEGSALGANRYFNRTFKYNQYPMMKLNQFSRDMIRIGKAIENKEDLRVPMKQFGKNVFGNALQGAIGSGLAAWGAAGSTGLMSRYSEATDGTQQFIKFLFESALQSMGGPIYQVYRQLGTDKPISQIAGSLMFPLGQAQALWDASWGNGIYKNMPWESRVATYVEQRIPGLQVLQTAMSTWGLTSSDHRYRAARAAFYRWQGSVGQSPKDEAFQKALKRATIALEKGDRAGYLQGVRDSVHAKDDKSAAAGLRARKILKNVNGAELSLPERAQAIERIGMEAFQILDAHDRMLEHVAEGL